MPINYVVKLTKQAAFTCHTAEVKMHLVEPKDARVFEALIAADYLGINSKIKKASWYYFMNSIFNTRVSSPSS